MADGDIRRANKNRGIQGDGIRTKRIRNIDRIGIRNPKISQEKEKWKRRCIMPEKREMLDIVPR